MFLGFETDPPVSVPILVLKRFETYFGFRKANSGFETKVIMELGFEVIRFCGVFARRCAENIGFQVVRF